MFNPYSIVLGLFTLGGLIMMLWGWRTIRKGQETQNWPMVEGIIEQTRNANDLLPEIAFSYTVDGQTYHQTLVAANDTPPAQTQAEQLANIYQQGNKIPIYYDPAYPDRVTLETGPKGSDWLVFIIGIGTMAFGIILLL